MAVYYTDTMMLSQCVMGIVLGLLCLIAHHKVNAFRPLSRTTSFASTRRRMTQLNMKLTGTCKFFDSTKGFGFITTESGEDVFVHQSSIYSQGFRSLMEGEPVEFDVQEDEIKKKKFAINVTGPNGAFVQGAPRRDRTFETRY